MKYIYSIYKKVKAENLSEDDFVSILLFLGAFATFFLWIQNLFSKINPFFNALSLPAMGTLFMIAGYKILKKSKNKEFWKSLAYLAASIRLQVDMVLAIFMLSNGSYILSGLSQFIPVLYLTSHFLFKKNATKISILNYLLFSTTNIIGILIGKDFDENTKQTLICSMLSHPFYIIVLHFIMSLKKTTTKMTIMNETLTEKLEKDVLTGIFNRLYLNNVFNNDLIELENGKINSMSILMIDIDHFKRINDTLGHPVGDEVLKQVAHKLKEITRKDDHLARWGGEEFVMVINNGDEAIIKNICGRILKEVQEIAPGGDVPNVTVSIGIDIRKNKESYKELLENADNALYEAKRSGRNKYSFAKNKI